MKLITNVSATAASRQSLDDYQPAVMPHPVDVVEAIKARYRFHSFPNTTPGEPFDNPSIYQSGVLQSSEGPIGILLLMMEATGDAAQAFTTHQADLVLDDVAAFMEEQFHFKVAASETRRSYVSNIVVEFDEAVEQHLESLGGIRDLMERARDENVPALKLKRIAFGGPLTPVVGQVGAVESADFIIERRVGAPAEKRRYFCSAPLRSERHVELLQEIEYHLMKG